MISTLLNRWYSRAAALASATLLSLAVAEAREYPTRPITLVVPFGVGKPTDAIARIVAQELSRMLGQPVQIENGGGASGTVGAARAARALPDGYTLLIHNIGLASAETIYKQLPYSAPNDLTPIGLLSEAPMVLIARADFPPQTMSQLVAFTQTQQDWVTLAHGEVGSASHLCALQFQAKIAASLIALGYRGNGPVFHDLLGGHVDLACKAANAAASAIRAGRVKAYAVTGPRRLPSLPNVPTTEEAGLASLDVRFWHGLYAPADTPKHVLRTLTSALRAALQSPELRTRLAEVDALPATEDQATPKALEARLQSEINRWAPLLKKAGKQLD